MADWSHVGFPGEEGSVSISEKTSYRKILWSLEATRLVVKLIVSLCNLTGTSAALKYKSCGFETLRNIAIRRPGEWAADGLICGLNRNDWFEGLWKINWHNRFQHGFISVSQTPASIFASERAMKFLKLYRYLVNRVLLFLNRGHKRAVYMLAEHALAINQATFPSIILWNFRTSFYVGTHAIPSINICIVDM